MLFYTQSVVFGTPLNTRFFFWHPHHLFFTIMTTNSSRHFVVSRHSPKQTVVGGEGRLQGGKTMFDLALLTPSIWRFRVPKRLAIYHRSP